MNTNHQHQQGNAKDYIRLSSRCFKDLVHYQNICKNNIELKTIEALKEVENTIADMDIAFLRDTRYKMADLQRRLNQCKKERLQYTASCIPIDKQDKAHVKAVQYIDRQLQIIDGILLQIATRFETLSHSIVEYKTDDKEDEEDNEDEEEDDETNNAGGTGFTNSTIKHDYEIDDEDEFLNSERLQNELEKLKLKDKEKKRQDDIVDSWREDFYEYLNMHYTFVPLRDYKPVSTMYLLYLYTLKDFRLKNASNEERRKLLAEAEANGYINNITLPYLSTNRYDNKVIEKFQKDINVMYCTPCTFELLDELIHEMGGNDDEKLEFKRMVFVIALIFANTEDSYYEWRDIYLQDKILPTSFPHYHAAFYCGEFDLYTMDTYSALAMIQLNASYKIENVVHVQENEAENNTEILAVLKMFVKRDFDFDNAFNPHKMLDKLKNYTNNKVKLSATQKHNYSFLRRDPFLCQDIANWIKFLYELTRDGENSRGLTLSTLYEV